MIPRSLRPWLVAILVVAAVAAIGAARPEPLAASQNGPAGSMAATVVGWSGAEGVLPVRLQVGLASAHERSVRVKLPLPVAALFAMALAAVMIRRAVRPPVVPRAPLAGRVRSVPRRGPPQLLLG